MLHRSFKAGKCKTSLKLAVARIKLLKNKREVQLRQMKKDLAHLLESGQEKTAMIRVEHVVREEKTMAAYDLIDIYCELIVARLPIIESQKNCPIDLKEAVTSIIFASPRCADIPELLDARKHFTAKYGKDFITSALELRPDCGVNRLVIDKLSARAPDGQTKLKILTEIAQEHNVEWDPKAFGEKELKPPEDLLNGPPVTEPASWKPAEPLDAHHPPYSQKPESSYVKNNFTRSSHSSQTPDPTSIRTPHMTMLSMEPRASGSAAESREYEHSSSKNVNNFTRNRQNWSMEFKDATSAAQAAAESAERASLAARAAAELSSVGKVTRQYSTGSNESLMQNQQRNRNERGGMQGASGSLLGSKDTKRKSSHSASSGSGMANIEGDHDKTDIYCQKCSSEVETVNKTEDINIQSSHFGVESVDPHLNMNRSGHTNSMQDGIGRQSSKSSSSDDNGDVISVSDLPKYGDDGGDLLFSSQVKGSTERNTKQPSFDDYPPVIFDEVGSDDETTGHEYGLYNPSPGTYSPAWVPETLNTWSPGRHRGGLLEETSNVHSPFISESYSPPELLEKTTKTSSPSQSGDIIPAAFDDSDGLDSESEKEIENAKLSGRRDSINQWNSFTISPESTQRAISSSLENEAKVVDRKPWSHSSDDSDSDGAYPKRNQETEGASWKENHGLGDSPNVQPSAGHIRTSNSSADHKAMSYSPAIEEKQQQPPRSSRYSLTKDLKPGVEYVAPHSPVKGKDSEISTHLSSESGKELDLGKLKGGFRNKGYTHPPYRKGPSVDNSSLSKQQQTEDTKEQSFVSSVARPKTNSETSYQEESNQTLRAYVNKEMSSRNSKTTFESDSDDDDVFQHQTAGSRGKSGGRLSRRTREPTTLSDESRFSTSTSGSRVTVQSDNPQIQARSSGSRRSLRTNISVEQIPDPQLQSRRAEKSKLAGANISGEHQPSKFAPKTERPLRDENLEFSRSAEAEQSSNPPPNSSAAETLKRLSLNKESASRENSLKKAGHVHPKLPDYDTFAAHFESLRSSR